VEIGQWETYKVVGG